MKSRDEDTRSARDGGRGHPRACGGDWSLPLCTAPALRLGYSASSERWTRLAEEGVASGPLCQAGKPLHVGGAPRVSPG